MIVHNQYQMQTLLRKQSSLVEITDAVGCSRGTVDPARALELVMRHSFEGFGDLETVRYLRLSSMPTQRNWTQPAEGSICVVGHRAERKSHQQDRCNSWTDRSAQ